jgi:hypothetical protein
MQEKTIMRYLDCGCAVWTDGSLTRCPTCAHQIEIAEGLSMRDIQSDIQAEARMERADRFRGWQETTNESQDFNKALNGLRRSVSKYIESCLEQFEDSETNSVPQTSYHALAEHLTANLVNVIASTVRKKER